MSLNCAALCSMPCHRITMTENPHLHRDWFLERLGEERMALVVERSNMLFKDLNGRSYSKAVDKEMAKHYRNEFAVISGKIMLHEPPKLTDYL